MSAAEKLKALAVASPVQGATGPTGTGPQAQALMAAAKVRTVEDVLVCALPQIVAVVEEAQFVDDEDAERQIAVGHQSRLGAALAALDEALS